MRKMSICLFVLLLAAWPPAQQASGWEWQFSLGPWTLAPWTSPVAREAQQLVSEEAGRLLAPLLSEFTIFAFEPQIDLRSRGWFATAGCWRRLNRDKFALGILASYLNFSLPFTLTAEQDIFFLDIPVAHISTSGQGQIDLRTIMLTAQGRWHILQTGRIGVYTGLGLSLLGFSGTLHLPLTASVQTFLGTVELRKSEDSTLEELRRKNHDIPAWILAPALSLSLHYRVGAKSRLLMEINLSQGTFLAIGLILGN
ncbi:MAG: hypothetical protein KKG79_02025 [Acidobacteria bacterium]|nr:hypothetical protein [Acidobacteriota bacterium]